MPVVGCPPELLVGVFSPVESDNASPVVGVGVDSPVDLEVVELLSHGVDEVTVVSLISRPLKRIPLAKASSLPLESQYRARAYRTWLPRSGACRRWPSPGWQGQRRSS